MKIDRKTILTTTLAVVVLLPLGWFTWYFISIIQQTDPNVKAGLVGVLGLILAALLAHHYTKRREIVARHYSDKRQGYMNIINILFDIISSTKSGKKPSEKQLADKMMTFKKALIVWGGPEVIETWNEFEITSSNGDLKANEMIIQMEKILRAIRKDLGHDDRSLKFGSLWGLVLVADDKKKLLDEN